MKHLHQCETCGAVRAPLKLRRSGRLPGVLETNSLPGRVVNWLHDHPGEELTGEDIATKFDPSGKLKPHDVGKRLWIALTYGYIETVISARGKRVFRKPVAVHTQAP